MIHNKCEYRIYRCTQIVIKISYASKLKKPWATTILLKTFNKFLNYF